MNTRPLRDNSFALRNFLKKEDNSINGVTFRDFKRDIVLSLIESFSQVPNTVTEQNLPIQMSSLSSTGAHGFLELPVKGKRIKCIMCVANKKILYKLDLLAPNAKKVFMSTALLHITITNTYSTETTLLEVSKSVKLT